MRPRSKSVSQFLSQYKAENTKRIYRSAFRKFFGRVYPELAQILEKGGSGQSLKLYDERMDELSIQYVESNRDFEADVVSFRDSIADLAPKTQAVQLHAVFRFLEDNSIEFPRQWKKNIIGRGSGQPISKERVPSPGELKRIIYHLPAPAKALVYVLATSGMRPGEALQLNIDDLELDYVAEFLDENGNKKSVPIPKINIRAETTKTKGRFTFITTEAKQELEKWLSYRDEYVERIKRRGVRHSFSDKLDEGRLFPFTETTFSSMWETALKKAGLYNRDPRTNRLTIRPHNLRKFFRTWGGWSNRDVPECLMGHQQGLNAIYARADQALRLLVEEYKRAEKNLTLSEQVVIEGISDEEVREIKDTVTQLRAQYVELDAEKRKSDKQLEKLEKEYESLDNVAMMLVQRILDLEEQLAEKDIIIKQDNWLMKRVAKGKLELVRRELKGL